MPLPKEVQVFWNSEKPEIRFQFGTGGVQVYKSDLPGTDMAAISELLHKLVHAHAHALALIANLRKDNNVLRARLK
jgi:hypothetical protein